VRAGTRDRWRSGIYGQSLIYERHRHRFEFNCLYEPTLAESGMRVSGRSPDGKFVEIAELPSHPWFVAVQFHPEFQSKRSSRTRSSRASSTPVIGNKTGELAPVSKQQAAGSRQ